jgi:hypothetical protein
MASTQRLSSAHPQRPQQAPASFKLKTRPKKCRDDEQTSNIRNHLAVLLTSLLVILALLAAVQIGAMPVIQLLLPLIGTIIGFYFGVRFGRNP